MSLIKINPVKQAQADAQARVAELKQKLRDTDYVTLPDYDRDRPEILAERQAWRDEIRTLEDQLEQTS